MTEEHKLKFLYNLFNGEAFRFFHQNVKTNSRSYLNAKCTLLRHFNSHDVQNRIKN